MRTEIKYFLITLHCMNTYISYRCLIRNFFNCVEVIIGLCVYA